MHDIDPNHTSHDTRPPEDPVLDAIGGAAGALRTFTSHTNEVLEAFDRAVGRRQAGASYREIAEADGAFVTFTSGPLKELLDALGEFRRQQARALYDEGMTMAELGRLFGVTRQRVAVLLDDKRSRPET
jgi:hypothetical protein